MIQQIFQKELMITKRCIKRVRYLSLLVLKDIGFKYKLCLCNGCHSLIQKAKDFIDFAIFVLKESDFRIHFWYVSKDDAISIMNNSNLNDKNGAL